MSDLESKLAEAREGIMPNDVSEMAASHRRAFDACAAIAREVVAKRDAEIAQALDDLARWESIARDSIKYGLEKDAEIARLEAQMRDANVCSFSDPEPLRGRQWCSVHSQSKAFCDAQFRPLPEVDECPNCAWSPSDKADETPKKAQPRKVTDAQREAIDDTVLIDAMVNAGLRADIPRTSAPDPFVYEANDKPATGTNYLDATQMRALAEMMLGAVMLVTEQHHRGIESTDEPAAK
jgi:hypothetical protein